MAKATEPGKMEIEIKVRLTDRAAFTALLPAAGFHVLTPETMERNILFDAPENLLRQRSELLRIRQYGDRCILTHKAPAEKSASATHKVRVETETKIENGQALATILERLGYKPIFIYEKFRTEWTDNEGHIVVDGTPMGILQNLKASRTGLTEWPRNLEFQQKII